MSTYFQKIGKNYENKQNNAIKITKKDCNSKQ